MAIKKMKSDEAFKEAIETAKIQNQHSKPAEVATDGEPKLSQTMASDTVDIRSS